MNPLENEQKTFHEIVRLYSRVRVIQIKENKELAKMQRNNGAQTERVIRRPAGDDWF